MGYDTKGQMASSERMFAWIEALVRFSPRLPTTEGGPGACRYLTQEFDRIGLERVSVEETPTLVWAASRHGLVAGGHRYPSHPMSHSYSDARPGEFATPTSGLSAELIFLGDGSPEDFEKVDVEGKIIVAEGRFDKIHAAERAFHVQGPAPVGDGEDFVLDVYSPNTFPANYYRAVEAGAAGFIGVISDYYHDRESYSNEAYDAYNGSPLTIPGLWVSPSTGEALRDAIASAGGAAPGELVLEGSLQEATSRSVLGYLPGSGPDRHETIVVESHYDSATPGAVQDASGVSAVLAIADYFAHVPAERRNRSLLFCVFDTHSGDYAAHHNFVETHLQEDNVVFVASIEHIGMEVIDGPRGPVMTEYSVPRILWVSPVDELVEIAVDVVKANEMERTSILPADYHPDELPCDADHLYQAGVPVLSLVGVPMYIYDEIDTSDKVNRRQLRPTAQAFADAVARIDRLPSTVLAQARRPRRETAARQAWISRQTKTEMSLD